MLSPTDVAAALDCFTTRRPRRARVRTLTLEAWTMRHNLSFADALYVTLAERLDAPLLTIDQRLAASPNLPVQTLG